MVAISIMIEGQMGLTWPRWQQLVAEVDALGFAGLFRSDHYTNARPPDSDSLEAIVALTYLAAHSRQIHFGPLVAPLSVREPTMLARQAAAIDDLSGGRLILGLGAGWQEREHTLFGHDLGDIPTRMARFEEGLAVISRLLGSATPVTYEGQFYQLRGATLLPRPARPGGPPILIGGNGPRRTLPLVARYAQIWNAVGLAPDAFRARSSLLDGELVKAGRAPDAVRRTLMTTLIFGADPAALARTLAGLVPLAPATAGQAPAAQQAFWREERQAVVGTPDAVVEQIAAYAAAGVEELMLQWFDLDDIAGLQALAATVLPRVRAGTGG
ncbi:MAG TPA: TIGR03560 family F420-dependent LLM class oxidoreductase [Chloroflexia bacterium]|nr:TIGR03560 family F420-dependent LLM class oxidoreductase [Chloroflexia bacterium]